MIFVLSDKGVNYIEGLDSYPGEPMSRERFDYAIMMYIDQNDLETSESEVEKWN